MPAAAFPEVMGIVNVTPDSFVASARTEDLDSAVSRGRQLFGEGAAVVDVGGESTRPGATPVAEAIELERVLPVIDALRGDGRLSIDTIKPAVAVAAVAAGASIINDVSGGLAAVDAELSVGWVAMHAQGTPATMQLRPRYGDVVAEVAAWLEEKGSDARRLGVKELWLDPGIGFGKSYEHNWSLLRHLDELAELAERLDAGLLVGTSRKRFLGELSAAPQEPDARLEASVATAITAMDAGATMVRVHDVDATVQAARIFAAEPVGS